MNLICNTCERRFISRGCLDCRLKQFDQAAYFFATDGLSEQESVDKTEEIINKQMRITSDKYDARCVR